MTLENAKAPSLREALVRAITEASFDEELARAVVRDSEDSHGRPHSTRHVRELLASREAAESKESR